MRLTCPRDPQRKVISPRLLDICCFHWSYWYCFCRNARYPRTEPNSLFTRHRKLSGQNKEITGMHSSEVTIGRGAVWYVRYGYRSGYRFEGLSLSAMRKRHVVAPHVFSLLCFYFIWWKQFLFYSSYKISLSKLWHHIDDEVPLTSCPPTPTSFSIWSQSAFSHQLFSPDI